MVYRWLFPLLWVVFVAFWIAMARGGKAVAERESVYSRLSHYLPLAIAIHLLAAPYVPIVGLQVKQQVTYPTDASGPLKSSILYYEVKFDVITAGTVSPGWKLVNATINQSGTFLTASRDRTHDLQITLGPASSTPIDPTNPKGPKNGSAFDCCREYCSFG